MRRLNPSKLRVAFTGGATPRELELPRRYTLTHSDTTGDLFLSIGSDYDRKQMSGFYTRLMRDEVLAEFTGRPGALEFRVFCHVSGGLVVGGAGWRYRVFRAELDLALEAIRYGDRSLIESNPDLDRVQVAVHFQSSRKRYNRVESWGMLGDYSDRT